MSDTQGLIPPHGGVLVNRIVSLEDRYPLAREAEALETVRLSRREVSDLLLIAEGALSPLTGFSGKEEVESIVERGRLPSGLAWTIPITLQAKGARATQGERVALTDEQGRRLAVLQVRERFRLDVERIAERVFKTSDKAHPGVAVLLSEDPERLAGEIELLVPPETARAELGAEGGGVLRLSPREVRRRIAERGWHEVAAFQTRNPLHRSHEYLLRVALEVSDGLLLHPLVGETKKDDVPADVRLACYQALIEGYLPKSQVILSALDAPMRYAGPAEAIHHSIMRQNFGASRFIVGRDHAGVGKYYGPFEAQARFDEYRPTELGIRPLKIDVTFWCNRCGGPASARTCPHGQEDRLALSGSEVRRRLVAGDHLPKEFTRPEVAEILRGYYRRLESENRSNGETRAQP